MAKPCKNCASAWHTTWQCPLTAKATLKATKPMKRGKRLKTIGRIGKKLHQQRQDFLAEHKPPYLCVYCIFVGYENFLELEWVNVEHGQSKVRHPDKRFEKSNLYIACGFHNKDKGSMDIDEYFQKLAKLLNTNP